MQSGNGFRRAFSLALVLMLLVITGAPAFAASKSSPSGSYVVTASRLNVHSTPSLGNVTRKLKRGAVVTYVRSKNGWWYVKFSGGSGYVDKTYLKSMGSTTATYKTTCNLYVRYSASATSTAIGIDSESIHARFSAKISRTVEAGSPLESTLSRILTKKSTTNRNVIPKRAAKKGPMSSFNT